MTISSTCDSSGRWAGSSPGSISFSADIRNLLPLSRKKQEWQIASFKSMANQRSWHRLQLHPYLIQLFVKIPDVPPLFGGEEAGARSGDWLSWHRLRWDRQRDVGRSRGSRGARFLMCCDWSWAREEWLWMCCDWSWEELWRWPGRT